jgi:hypothetical protein
MLRQLNHRRMLARELVTADLSDAWPERCANR